MFYRAKLMEFYKIYEFNISYMFENPYNFNV